MVAPNNTDMSNGIHHETAYIGFSSVNIPPKTKADTGDDDNNNNDGSSTISESPTTPPPHSEIIPNDDTVTSGGSDYSNNSIPLQSNESALEERVHELETKLATLSLLLQQQQTRRRSSISPAETPPHSPPSPPPPPSSSRDTAGHLPVLESPAPIRPSLSPAGIQRRRNLSFRVLHSETSHTSVPAINAKWEQSLLSPQPTRSTLTGDDVHIDESAFMSQSLLDSQPSSPNIRMFAKKIAEAMEEPIIQKKKKEAEDADKEPMVKTAATTTPEKDEKKDVKSKWLDYLNSFQDSTYDTDKQMEEFVKVPGAVEALLSFGFWISVDSFLYILTILPIRFVWSSLLLLRFVFIRIFTLKNPSEGPFRFHRRHSYQLIQVSIIYIIYKYVLMPVSIGKLYHWIRGQNMVKLYVLIAMVEIFDRLMCSLGQDCLDSLYWNTTRRPRSTRLIVSVLVVLIYTAFHSFLLFAHVATLNVAMNSDDQALMSLLIGGNFAEIKSTVFKKYNKANLFKITASDICERFKLALFLALVLLLNMSQGMDEKMLYNYFHMCGIVVCAELMADWIKHAFITKLNFISSNIYPEYGLLLAGDVTGIGHEGVNLDHSHAVVKRIGLAQLPLVCVMARYIREGYKYATYESDVKTWMIALGFFAIWLVLLLCKHSLGSFLHKISYARLEAAPEFSSKNAKLQKKEEKKEKKA